MFSPRPGELLRDVPEAGIALPSATYATFSVVDLRLLFFRAARATQPARPNRSSTLPATAMPAMPPFPSFFPDLRPSLFVEVDTGELGFTLLCGA